MAVEIPVIVDIEGAFQDAAKRAQQAMKPLQEALTQSTLNIQIPKIGTLDNVLKSTTISADQVAKAMAHIKKEMTTLNKSGGFLDASGAMTAQARQLTAAYAALEAKMKSGVNAVEQAINGTQRLGAATRDTTSAMTAQSSVLTKLIASFSAYASIHTLLRFAKQIRDVTGELEYQRIALGHLIQDSEYGAQLFERIKKAAVESPFRIKDLVTYTKQLAAYRIETTQLFDTTKRLADVSAGLGVDMNRLILAYGQVRAASVLRGQELRQFTEAGIPLVELLADKFTELRGEMVTTADVFKLISERAVPFSMISEIFQDMTDAGGQFYQMQETQAKTLQGRWEKLKDTFDIALQEIGDTKTFRGEMDLLLKTLNFLAKNLRVVPKLMAAGTVAAIGYAVAAARLRAIEQASIATKASLTTAELRNIAAMNLGKTAARVYARAQLGLKAATSGLSRAFWKLTAAMAANPIIAIATGITALIALFFQFRKRTKEATDEMKKLSEWTDTIERQGQIIGQNKRMETLIKRYERLATKTNLTAKEQQSLSQTMRVLQGQFHNITIELGNANNSVATQIASLRKLNKEQQEAAISTLNLTKAQIEQRLTILGEQEQQQTAVWLAANRTVSALEGVTKMNRKQIKGLKKAKEEVKEYGDALNQTSAEINTLQNRLVSIENILNPQIETPAIESASDRLSKLKEGISDITNAYKKFVELQKYMQKEDALGQMKILFPALGSWEPTYENMVSRLENMLNQYHGDADATRIIEQAIANIKFDKIKGDIEDTLKRLTAQVKQSETARNFFNNILEVTGDRELSASLTMSVYGQTGKEFKERVQDEMFGALESVKNLIGDDFYNEMIGNVTIFDIAEIRKQVARLPEAIRPTFERLLSESEKFNENIAQNLIKTLEQAKTYGDKQVEIAKKSAKRVSEINALDVAQPIKDKLIKQNAKKEAEETAKVQYEAFKDSSLYIELFSNLDGASTRMLTNMRNNLIALKSQWKNLSPRELREMQSKINEIDEQLATRNPFTSLIASLKEYRDLTKDGSRREADENAMSLANYARLQKELLEDVKERYETIVNSVDATEEEKEQAKEELEAQAEETDLAIEQAEAAQETASAFQKAAKHIQDAADGLKEWQGYITTSLEGVGEIISTFASDNVSDTFNIISDGISKAFGGLTTTASSIARIFAGDLTAIPSLIKGLGESISGIFGTKKQLQMKNLDKQIKDQSDLLEELEYSYQRLEAAMAKAFGSDYIYNYNQQLKNLAAQQSAYEEQARLEREKGKKADEDKIKEYENSARDVADKIADMQGQLSEFFAGTDVASAAKDFASAWIDAYKQFGSTTDAMKEKFQDMINEMVQSAMFAQLGQYILEDFFKEIDQKAKDGELTAQEVAEIANMAPEYVTKLNDAFTVANNELQKYGLNLRDTVGTFTGISRNIAGASEESITGLTAGINAQNFYMQHIDASVTAILAAMTGGTTVTNVGAEGAVTNPYNEAMMLYAAHIPTIEDKLATLLTEVQKVIKPRSTNPDWALHTVVH